MVGGEHSFNISAPQIFTVLEKQCLEDSERINELTRPRQSVPNSGFHLVGPGLILVNLV